MKHKKSFLGALLLSALAVCAFGAANASALTMHECKKSTTGTGIQYEDAACSKEKPKTGEFETEPIPENTEVGLEATLTPTTAGMNVTAGEEAGTHAVLHAVLGGISVQITCTGVSSPGAKAKNVKVGETMFVVGEGKSVYTGCAISNSALAKENCQVPATLETVVLSQTTEGMSVVFKPKAGGNFIIIPFTSKAGKTCPAAILGEKEVTGTAKGAVAGPTAIEFTSTSGSELKLGGVAAQFTAVIHFRTATGDQNTIALETNATTDNK